MKGCLLMDDYLKNWLEKAGEDLKVAKHELALPDDEMVSSAICFHCQQAVEKYIKAFLVANQMEFGKTHNLEYLIELASSKSPEISDVEIGNLSFFAVNARYPDSEFIELGRDDCQKAVQIAENIRVFVMAKINLQH